jgi:hypothetical protein
VREPRRGELNGIPASYAATPSDWLVLVDTCRKLTDKTLPSEEQLTFSQVKDLCARAKLGNLKYTTITNYIYGVRNPKDKALWSIEPDSWQKLTGFKSKLLAQREASMLLSLEAEEVLLNVAVRCVRRRGVLDRAARARDRARQQLAQCGYSAAASNSSSGGCAAGGQRALPEAGSGRSGGRRRGGRSQRPQAPEDAARFRGDQ